jgi:hypothetical protein
MSGLRTRPDEGAIAESAKVAGLEVAPSIKAALLRWALSD